MSPEAKHPEKPSERARAHYPGLAEEHRKAALQASRKDGKVSRFNRALRHWANGLLEFADVQLDGPKPWDLQVRDPRLFARVYAHGSLGFGESYVDGWWDAEDLVGCLARILRSRADTRVQSPYGRWLRLRFEYFNLQRDERAWTVGRQHYDLGNDLFEAMLGERLVYSCGYWAEVKDLDTAQLHKLDLCCRKLQLEPGMRVLDIGCGWGEALKHATQYYGSMASESLYPPSRPNTPAARVRGCRWKFAWPTIAASTSRSSASFR